MPFLSLFQGPFKICGDKFDLLYDDIRETESTYQVNQTGLASFCQSRKNQWQKPVITGMAKTLWQKLVKTTWAKNICMTNIICKINLKPINDHSYLKKSVYFRRFVVYRGLQHCSFLVVRQFKVL